MSEKTISWNPPPVPVTSYNVFRGPSLGQEAPTPYASVPPPLPVAISSVATNGVYTGTFPDGANNLLAGISFVISGFPTPANNGTFICSASDATHITLNNNTAVAEAAGAASGQPFPYFTDHGVFPSKRYAYEVQSVIGALVSADSLEIISDAVPFPPSPSRVNLRSAVSFEVLAGSTVTNTGTTTASGDVGVWPGSAITGFGPPSAISGSFHAGDFVAQAAQLDLTTAFNDAMSRTGAVTLSGDIGGQTLPPGVYVSSSSLGITGALYLDAGGDPNAVWVFQIGSTLTTASGNSAVLMQNGGQAENVYWAVGSSATLNDNTHFAGTVMAQASITVNSNVNVNGRLLAQVGAVTLIGDVLAMQVVGHLIVYSQNKVINENDIFFDCVSGSYQQALNSGVSGGTRPTFSPVYGTITQDNTVRWISLDSQGPTVVLLSMPGSGPNVPPPPPPPPATPTGLRFASQA
jgi:Ice-binding-like